MDLLRLHRITVLGNGLDSITLVVKSFSGQLISPSLVGSLRTSGLQNGRDSRNQTVFSGGLAGVLTLN